MVTEIVPLRAAVGADGGASPAALGGEWPRRLGARATTRAQVRTLTEANQRMGEFLGTATHELKTPVASSSLAVALAAQRLDTLQARLAAEDVALAGQAAPIQDLLRRAEESLERLTRLVVDLLDVSRIGTGRLELRLAHCDLAAVVGEVVEEQRRIAPTRTIRLRVPDRPLAPVLADADRIRQVATNYLTNALRYSPEDRPVDTYVQQRGNWVHVAVRDAGPGVPHEEQKRIWERFHRAAGVRAVSGTGTGLGLGLHICKTIIEQHQGRMGLRSAPGKGSTFWFALAVAGVDRRRVGGTVPP